MTTTSVTTRRRERWAAAVLAALVVVGLVLGYALWWSRPTAFVITSPSFTPTPGTVDASHPITSTVAKLPDGGADETVDISRVRPVLTHNTAQARVTFHVCRYTREGFLSAPGTAGDSCTEVSPVDGRQVRLTRHTAIVMTVTPRHAGRVLVSGVAITYSRGAGHWWQHGTQASDVFLDVRVPG